MTEAYRLDFPTLKLICTNWKSAEIPRVADYPLLERIRQILVAIRSGATNCYKDLIPLVRQVLLLEIRSNHTSGLFVPQAPGWPSIKEWSVAGFDTRASGDRIYISARPPRLAWLGNGCDLFDDAFTELSSRPSYGVPMDPFLEKATKLSEYQSRGQREALRAMLQLPPGVTLIANLPTGSGKSLLGQAAALVDGGPFKITIVIVPTVALAIDQERRMADLFRTLDPNWKEVDLAYHSGIDEESKRTIKERLRDGTQRILFASPESVTGSLHNAIEMAATSGYLRYLVIDEAHLVVGWGDAFRPAFQLLPAVVRKLNALNPERPLRTVLASATLTTNTVKVLQRLFGPPEKTYMVAALHLRPEPRYWFHEAPDEVTRAARVQQAIQLAPRPFILYLTERKDALAWYSNLRGAGYRRVEVFHGGTPAHERERILHAWARNELDGVVATSAFGLGVDKSDVRAVIHATLPESLDRYYQEVGRGGRDGRACASLLVFTKADFPLAQSISAPTLISNELGYERWELMRSKAVPDPIDQSLFWVDLRLRPSHVTQTSDANKAWNLRTLTLMARAQLIDLAAVESELDDAKNETTSVIEHAVRAAVRIRSAAHAERRSFYQALVDARTDTMSSSLQGLDAIADVATGRQEISSVLRQLYALRLPGATADVEICCGGCPRHWGAQKTTSVYHEPVVRRLSMMVDIDVNNWRQRWPAIGGNTLLIALPPTQFDTKVVRELMRALCNAIRLHTVLIGIQDETFIEQVREVMRDQWWQPQFLDTYIAGTEDTVYGATGEVRLVIMDPQNQLPTALWMSPCAFQILVIPTSMVDPDQPLRRLIDTHAHISYDDFMSKISG